MKKIKFNEIYYNYKIKKIYKLIKNVELNIYFNGWNGQDCIEYTNYCYSEINDLKLKLKKYE